MKASVWQRNILFVAAFVLDLVLLVRLPETAKVSGRVERDIIPVITNATLAAIIVWPCLRLIRVGKPWQQVLGLTFLVLPAIVLFESAWWAISRW